MTASSRLTWIGRAFRSVIVFGYLVWVAIGFCMFRGAHMEPSTLRYRATKGLPAGYRLDPDDFTFNPLIPPGERNRLPTEADPTGKYLLKAKEKEVLFGPADLTSAPLIEVGAGKVRHLFSLKNQPELPNLVNTNSHVSVCSGDCPIDDARVLAILCSATRPSDCYAALELTKEDEAKLKDKSEYLVIPRNKSER